MILRELFYFNRDTAEPQQDDRYMSNRDTSVVQADDTRKTRLTLGQINELRRASDQHIKEQQAEMEFISRMYAAPAEAPA
jgi:hypothetical protein